MELTERFLKLVSYPTTSDEGSETCPSTPGQLVLARAIVEDMRAMALPTPTSMTMATSMAPSPPLVKVPPSA